MTALSQRLRENDSRERSRMHFAQQHAELRMAPAKAAIVVGRILRAAWLDEPATAGLGGAMAR